MDNITSPYVLKNIFEFDPHKTYLNLLKYNKKLQNKLKLSIDSYYKAYSQIEIEVIPIDDLFSEKNKFINRRKEYKSSYHIFFNEEEKEIDRDYITKDDKVSKIKIIIDFEVTSLKELFSECCYIKEIKFTNFF